jgi:LysM repeat protein
LKRFKREDLALAAYNGGPGVVTRSRAPLETLQYVIGVGNNKNALLQHEPRIRDAATRLRILRTEEDDSWWSLSERTGIPLLQLRLYNPFLALRPLSSARLVVYPAAPEPPVATFAEDSIGYVTRPGDHYILLAAAFGVAPHSIREANGLWHVDLVFPGTALDIPLQREQAKWVDHTVKSGEDVGWLADHYSVPVWNVIRDNRLWDQQVGSAETVRVDIAAKIPRYASYKVRRGDTLTGIAQRHSVGLASLRKANGFSSGHWRIRIGDVLKIPLS